MIENKKAWTAPQLMVLETAATQVGTTPGPEGFVFIFAYSS